MSVNLKGPLTALMVSSLAIIPATTIAYVATADAAFAKSDKAGGNGNGKGNGGSAKSSKSSAGGAKGKSETKSASSGGSGKSRGHGGLDGFFEKLTGKEKAKSAKSKSTGASSKPAKIAGAAPKARPEKDAMHPSNLGKMNGPMNASINAVLAHIKNGNTNGPIGAFAAMAVAGANAEGAQDVLDLKQDFIDLQTALENSPYSTVEEYFAALEGAEPLDPIEPIEIALTELGEAQATQNALATALEDAGYMGDNALFQYEQAVTDGATPVLSVETAKENLIDPSGPQGKLDAALADAGFDGTDPLADYQAAKDGSEPIDPIEDLDTAIATLGGDASTYTAPTATEPSDEDVAGAEEDLQARTDAEIAMLEHWNKNTDTDPETITDEEQAILDKLYERLEPYSDEIGALLPEEEVIEEETGPEGETADCTAEDTECAGEEEIAAVE